LALSKRIVESVIQILRTNSQTAGGIAIDDQLRLETVILLVCVYVSY
jgi:hypothetical protein